MYATMFSQHQVRTFLSFGIRHCVISRIVPVFWSNLLPPSSGWSFYYYSPCIQLLRPIRSVTVDWHYSGIIPIAVSVLNFFPDINSSDKLRLSGQCACECDWPIQQECWTSCRVPAALRPSAVGSNVASVASEGLAALHWAWKWKRYSLVSMLTYIYANGWSAKGGWHTVNEQI